MRALRCVPRRAVATAHPAARTNTTAAAAPVRHTNIGTFIDQVVSKHEWRDAFRDSKANHRWTYKEFGQFITGYAAGFNGMPGGHRGKRMLALTGNAAETVVTLLAAARIGATYGVVDATLAEEVSPAIEAGQVSTLIVPPSFDKELLRLIPEWNAPLFRDGLAPQGPVRSLRHRSLRFVLSTGWQYDGHTGPLPLREVYMRDPIPNPLPAINLSIPSNTPAVWEHLPHATIAYSHAGLLAQAESIASAFGLRMEDRVLNALLYDRATAITTSLATWLNGATLISAGAEPRDPLLTLKTLNAEHASVFVAPLELYNLIVSHAALAKHPFPAPRLAVVVVRAGQVPTPAEIDRINEVFKANNLLLASTAGEAGLAFVRPLLSGDSNQLGATLPGAEARVEGDGQLRVRTPQAHERQVLSGTADEWTATNLKASLQDGGFVLDHST